MKSEELYHYGVKGMKWGHRRTPEELGHRQASSKGFVPKKQTSKKAETDVRGKTGLARALRRRNNKQVANKAREKEPEAEKKQTKDQDSKPERSSQPQQNKSQKTDTRKKLSEMTDAELNDTIKRLELEKRYKDLSRDPATVSRGKKLAMDILYKSAENIGAQLVTYAMGEGVNRLAKQTGFKNATRTITDDAGRQVVEEFYENIVNPRKGQKDKSK